MNAITSLKTFLTDRVELFGSPSYAAADRLSLPTDDPHDVLAAGHGGEHDVADGQSFVIDYVDHAGHPSHRRITVWAVQRNLDGVPILIARCHERQATRAFRVDRITAVTDLDGTPRTPLPRFFLETFGFLWPREAGDAGVTPSQTQEVRHGQIRGVVRRAGVPLLAALARADGETKAAEVEETVFFAERACDAAGIDLTGAERAWLSAYVGRMRPTAETIEATLDTLIASGGEAIAAVLKAGLRVARADGALRADELELLDTYCFALTGRRLVEDRPQQAGPAGAHG